MFFHDHCILLLCRKLKKDFTSNANVVIILSRTCSKFYRRKSQGYVQFGQNTNSLCLGKKQVCQLESPPGFTSTPYETSSFISSGHTVTLSAVIGSVLRQTLLIYRLLLPRNLYSAEPLGTGVIELNCFTRVATVTTFFCVGCTHLVVQFEGHLTKKILFCETCSSFLNHND